MSSGSGPAPGSGGAPNNRSYVSHSDASRSTTTSRPQPLQPSLPRPASSRCKIQPAFCDTERRPVVTHDTFNFKYFKFATLTVVSVRTVQRTYTIKEAAALTGLPASTLRYYESIGVIAPVERGESSKHRVFTEADLDQLMWVACLAATGMSVSDMRQYVANGQLGPSAAANRSRSSRHSKSDSMLEAEFIELRQRYVQLKIDYWQAIDAGDNDRAELLSSEARHLADELKQAKQH